VFLLLFSKTFRRLIAAVILALLGIVLWTAGQVWYVARQDDRPLAGAIVVLGASQFDGRPSPVFQARLDHAAALFKTEVAPLVVTVGAGAPGDRFTEAAAGRTYLRERGVTNTLAVEEGRDTLESLKAVRVVLKARGVKKIVLVTDPWHSLRAKRMAQDLDLRASTSPTRTGPVNQTRGTQFRYIAREAAAYLYYRLSTGAL
jgi:uncharacterized SAM-binding protein YcdF (DUF218 family)